MDPGLITLADFSGPCSYGVRLTALNRGSPTEIPMRPQEIRALPFLSQDT